MLSGSQEGERISFPVLEKEEGEARVPFSFGTEYASYFPCRESPPPVLGFGTSRPCQDRQRSGRQLGEKPRCRGESPFLEF